MTVNSLNYDYFSYDFTEGTTSGEFKYVYTFSFDVNEPTFEVIMNNDTICRVLVNKTPAIIFSYAVKGKVRKEGSKLEIKTESPIDLIDPMGLYLKYKKTKNEEFLFNAAKSYLPEAVIDYYNLYPNQQNKSLLDNIKYEFHNNEHVISMINDKINKNFANQSNFQQMPTTPIASFTQPPISPYAQQQLIPPPTMSPFAPAPSNSPFLQQSQILPFAPPPQSVSPFAPPPTVSPFAQPQNVLPFAQQQIGPQFTNLMNPFAFEQQQQLLAARQNMQQELQMQQQYIQQQYQNLLLQQQKIEEQKQKLDARQHYIHQQQLFLKQNGYNIDKEEEEEEEEEEDEVLDSYAKGALAAAFTIGIIGFITKLKKKSKK